MRVTQGTFSFLPDFTYRSLDIWKDVTFDYASTDAPDFVPTTSVS